MTYQRLAYEDASTTREMTSDCLVAEQNLHLPDQHHDERSTEPVQSIEFADYTSSTSSVAVPDSLAEMAAGMHLHFD